MDIATLDTLKNKILAKDEQTFLEAYENYRQQNDNRVLGEDELQVRRDSLNELLSKALSEDMLEAAKKLIEGLIIDKKYVGELKHLSDMMARCCRRGKADMIEWLLKNPEKQDEEEDWINKEPLLSLLVQHMPETEPEDKKPFYHSMKILMDDRRIDVNKRDNNERAALHYAVMWKIDRVLDLLLQKGAYIGGEDLFGELAISEMNPLLLKKHLDSCVTSNNRKPRDENYEVRINTSNFLRRHEEASSNVKLILDIQPIICMAQSPSTKQLLWHPVIASILMIKWMKLRWIIYTHLAVCTYCFISLGWYIVFSYPNKPSLCYCFSFVGYILLIVRELVLIIPVLSRMERLWRSIKKVSWRCITEVLRCIGKVVLLVFYGIVLFSDSTDEFHSMILIVVLLLLGMQLTSLFGMLPVNSIATYMIMLKTVMWNFIKCFIFSLSILLAFAACFFTFNRMQNFPKLDKTEGEHPTAKDSNEENCFNRFASVPLALIKTLVMFTGEFSAVDIMNDTSWPMYLLFTLFVFVVAFGINNLMTGIAVGDTTAIQAESEIAGITNMVQVIDWYERALNKRLTECYNSSYRIGPIIVLKSGKSPSIAYDYEINDPGQVRIQIMTGNEEPRQKQSMDKLLFMLLERMHNRIYKHALQILRFNRLRNSSPK